MNKQDRMKKIKEDFKEYYDEVMTRECITDDEYLCPNEIFDLFCQIHGDFVSEYEKGGPIFYPGLLI